MVRVQRHSSISGGISCPFLCVHYLCASPCLSGLFGSVTFQDDTGASHSWEKLDTATSELLQHEIDHLDGVLATDRVSDLS